MNNKIDVYYTMGTSSLNSIYFKPESVLKLIINERNKKSQFLKCPAFQDFYKNCFVIRSPIDLKITIQKTHTGEKYIKTFNYDQKFFNDFIIARMENPDFPCMSFLIPYLFYCDKSIIIEQMPSLMHKNDFLNNTRVISGKFDISKWYRPIEYAFEIIDDKVPLIIKRGDPLYYIRFLTDKDVNLIQTYEYEYSYVQKFSANCINTKNFIKGNILQKNYELVSDYLESIKKKIFQKKSKCPFNFFHKNKDE